MKKRLVKVLVTLSLLGLVSVVLYMVASHRFSTIAVILQRPYVKDPFVVRQPTIFSLIFDPDLGRAATWSQHFQLKRSFEEIANQRSPDSLIVSLLSDLENQPQIQLSQDLMNLVRSNFRFLTGSEMPRELKIELAELKKEGDLGEIYLPGEKILIDKDRNLIDGYWVIGHGLGHLINVDDQADFLLEEAAAVAFSYLWLYSVLPPDRVGGAVESNYLKMVVEGGNTNPFDAGAHFLVYKLWLTYNDPVKVHNTLVRGNWVELRKLKMPHDNLVDRR